MINLLYASGNQLPSAQETALSGHKRSYIATLYHNLNSTPSSFCKTDDKEGSWQQQLNLGFKNHRPNAGNAGIPTTLLHEAFGIFKDTFNSDDDASWGTGLVAEDFNFTAKFCREMSKVYSGKKGEDMRRDAANLLLGEYLGELVTPSKVCNAGTSETDGTVFALVGNDKRLPMPIMIAEVKTEIGSGGGEPTLEGLAYYMWSITHGLSMVATTTAANLTVMPLLLLSLVGPNLSFSFLATGETVVMDPATPFLSCLFLPFDTPQMTQTAKAFRAMKDCVKNLQQMYCTLQQQKLPTTSASAAAEGSSSSASPRTDQLQFPYRRHFSFHGSRVEFDYDKRYADKLVFEAHTTTAPSSGVTTIPPLNTGLIVKFTRTYCIEAHTICHSFHRAAPQLYAMEELAGGWFIVVMELLRGFDIYFPLDRPLHDELEAVIANLHAHGYVHGDLRVCNILVGLWEDSAHLADRRRRICLIDFDWTGKEGSTRYPGFMNHQDVEWPDGASDNLPLQKAHDVHFLNSFKP